MTTMAPMARLPAEVYGLIAAHSRREDLKALRLTDRTLSHVATAKLFEEMHISPNSSSFDRAHSVAAQRHLAQYVRGLVYHFGKLADIYVGFDSFKHEYYATRRSQSAYDPYELDPEVLWNYNCWLEEIDAQKTFELRDEAGELTDLCSRLPRLEAISTILDEANIFGDQEDYIGKRTGIAAIEDDGWLRFSRLFAAAVDKPLRKISARSIQWNDLDFIAEGSEVEIQAKRTCLSGLKHLELGIYRVSFHHEYDSDSDGAEHLERVDRYSAILGYAQHLETLKLDFDELPLESEPQEMLPLSQAIFKHHWPRLKNLKLEAFCVSQDEFCDFLFRHRTTLKQLCLGDIELVSGEEGTPSILSLFLRLHSFLHLESCRITGNFTNRVDQGWYVDIEHEQPGCLRDQLERLLCGAGSEILGIAKDEIEGDGSWYSDAGLKSYLHKIDGEYKTFEDESWQWAPELLSDVSPDASPT